MTVCRRTRLRPAIPDAHVWVTLHTRVENRITPAAKPCATLTPFMRLEKASVDTGKKPSAAKPKPGMYRPRHKGTIANARFSRKESVKVLATDLNQGRSDRPRTRRSVGHSRGKKFFASFFKKESVACFRSMPCFSTWDFMRCPRLPHRCANATPQRRSHKRYGPAEILLALCLEFMFAPEMRRIFVEAQRSDAHRSGIAAE